MRCPDCPPIHHARELFVGSLWPDLAYALLPFVVIAASVAVIMRLTRRLAVTADDDVRVGPVVNAGIVLGIGLGGFLDGIVLHQILQWHNMMSSVVAPSNLVDMKFNMIWDGLFHLLTWTTTLLGIGMLFRAGRRDVVWSRRILAGSMLAGWGLFNLVEGLIDHQILGIHHVHPGTGQVAWDWAFVLVGGLGFLGLGFVTARSELAGHVAV